MGMVGLRDLFVVAPASSLNHHHHHHHHHHHSPHHSHDSINLANDPINGPNTAAATALGVGVGVIPLLTAAPCLPPQNVDDQDLLNNGRNRSSGIQFWQNQTSHSGQYGNIKRNTTASILEQNNSSANLPQSGNSTGVGIGGNSSSLAPMTCHDCGNQAKKDCSHRRCRTCCKSRGFDCATHVKSTWVPAARRRERQLMAAAAAPGAAAAGSSGSTSGAKKPRLINSQTTTTSHTSTSNTTPPRSFDTSSSHQDASFRDNFPGQVRVPAVFKCVRVSAVDDGGEDEFAYQAVVKIGGHVFKGFLYDLGVEPRDGFPNLSELHLGGASSSGGAGGGRNAAGASSSSPILDPSDFYGPSGGGLLGG